MSHHREVPIEPFRAFDPYGGAAPPESLTGYLLVATPGLSDPNFSRRVILVLDHGDHGALGVVLDRPRGVAVDQLLPQWQSLATPPSELFTGGPVARNALIGLVRLGSRDDAAEASGNRPAGWRRRSTSVRGTSWPPRRATRSQPTPRGCGGGCSAVKGVPWPWCRDSPPIPP